MQKFALCKEPAVALAAYLHRSLAQAPKACARESVLHNAHRPGWHDVRMSESDFQADLRRYLQDARESPRTWRSRWPPDKPGSSPARR
jgi:hypothetical protein